MAGAWKGAFWSWGYLKSLHNKELRRFTGFKAHLRYSRIVVNHLKCL